MVNNEYLFLEKNMPKDRWTVPVPAEWSKQIGLEKGEPVYMGLDTANNRIILTSPKNDSELNLKTQSEANNKDLFSNEDKVELISDLFKDNSEVKDAVLDKYNRLPCLDNDETVVITRPVKKKRRGRPKGTTNSYVEKCYYCHSELEQGRNYLKINGHKICSECKKIEVQRFLLYLERRKNNGKGEKI